MSTDRLHLAVPALRGPNKRRFGSVVVILLLVIGCQQADIDIDESAMAIDTPTNDKVAVAELSEQLKVNRDALLQGSSEQIRITAATVMLFNEEQAARKILLDALEQSENIAARSAVCKALSQARAEQKDIKNKEDFIPLLFGILAAETNDSAKLAAEATLVFEYEQISKQLEKMITDASLPVHARLNAVYALKLQPDMEAIFKLIELLGDPESQVAAEAEKALRTLGIPVGKDTEAREQIIDELKRKGKGEFLRDWLIRQEAKMRELEADRDFWQKQYLAALEKICEGVSEDEAKGKFLAEHLGSSKAVVRLWALEKVSQWRVRPKSKLPAELGPILLNLISDQSRNVRLKTASLLSLMGELNSAEKLLQQLEVEQDDPVRTELFVALGAACHFASLPNSPVTISPEVRKQALGLASEFLTEQEPKKAQKGADVMKKLLSQNELTADERDRYLGLLVERYKQEKNKVDRTLCGGLLNAMAELCAQGSACKAKSAELFRPLFEEGLRDEAELVREAAVIGLINIDKIAALKTLREGFVNDPSVKVRERLIDLAGEVGGKEDLLWLAEKITAAPQGELAWQTMLKIFKRSDAAILNEWVVKFNLQSTKARLSDEQKIPFLEIAERKAVGENKMEMLEVIRTELAELYKKAGQFEQAAKYLGMLYGSAGTDEEKEAILPNLLDAYLRWPNIERAAKLVENCLLKADLEPNNPILLSIDDYFNEPPVGADPNTVLEALAKIKPPEVRPKWQKQVHRWAERLRRVQEPNEPKGAGG